MKAPLARLQKTRRGLPVFMTIILLSLFMIQAAPARAGIFGTSSFLNPAGAIELATASGGTMGTVNSTVIPVREMGLTMPVGTNMAFGIVFAYLAFSDTSADFRMRTLAVMLERAVGAGFLGFQAGMATADGAAAGDYRMALTAIVLRYPLMVRGLFGMIAAQQIFTQYGIFRTYRAGLTVAGGGSGR